MLETLEEATETARTGARIFNTTHWSAVLLASAGTADAVDAALEELCRTYWYPLYAYVRRRGHTPQDAQDLTQEFFARLLGRNYLRAVDRRKGKFRSFLLAAMEHFLANEWRRVSAQKRGGQAKFISLDDDTAEKQFQLADTAALPAEKVFEQQWALKLLEQTLAALRWEFAGAGKTVQFDRLKGFLTGERCAARYSDLAMELQTSEAALKMAVCRMRHRFGELLRTEIAKTVSGPDEMEEELRAVFAALS